MKYLDPGGSILGHCEGCFGGILKFFYYIWIMKEFIIKIERTKLGPRSYRKLYRLYSKDNEFITESGNFEKDIMPIITQTT